MILALIFPNMIGLFFLFPKVKQELNNYLKQLESNMIDKEIDSVLREIKDFPNKGINFKDITSLYFILSLDQNFRFSGCKT